MEQWPPWFIIAITIFILYVSVVRSTRHRRRDTTPHKFGYTSRASFASMTLDDAFAIQSMLAEQEFPKVFASSVFFALFKV
jgi:hypothetical protein